MNDRIFWGDRNLKVENENSIKETITGLLTLSGIFLLAFAVMAIQ